MSVVQIPTVQAGLGCTNLETRLWRVNVCLLFRSPLYRQDLVEQIWKPDFRELIISFHPLSLLENLSHSVAFCVLSRAGVSHNFPENILKKKLQIQVHVAGKEEAEEKNDANVGTDCQGRPRDNSIKE